MKTVAFRKGTKNNHLSKHLEIPNNEYHIMGDYSWNNIMEPHNNPSSENL